MVAGAAHGGPWPPLASRRRHLLCDRGHHERRAHVTAERRKDAPTAEGAEYRRVDLYSESDPAADVALPPAAGAFAATLRRAWKCTYDATADENFQIGWVPSVEGLYLVGGLSGHGFKHAPAIGESVAATVMGKAATVDLSSYSLRVVGTSG